MVRHPGTPGANGAIRPCEGSVATGAGADRPVIPRTTESVPARFPESHMYLNPDSSCAGSHHVGSSAGNTRLAPPKGAITTGTHRTTGLNIGVTARRVRVAALVVALDPARCVILGDQIEINYNLLIAKSFPS